MHVGNYFNNISITKHFHRLWLTNREFKKLLRLLQWKRHFKIELYGRLHSLQLFHVKFVTLWKMGEVSFHWHDINGFKQRQREKDLLLPVCVVIRASNNNCKISGPHLTNYTKKIEPKSIVIVLHIITFPHSTNHNYYYCFLAVSRHKMLLPYC